MNRTTLARLGVLAAAALAALTGGAAQAASIVSSTETFAPTTALITFDAYDNLLTSNDTVDGVQLTSLTDMVIGADQQDLGQNGLWGARVAPTPTGEGNFLATFSATTLSFGLYGGQAQVGAFFNQYQDAQDADPSNNSITLTAYGAANNILESFNYTIDTAWDTYNEGVYLGFSRASADIYKIEVSGGTVTLDNLGLSTSPVPEPASLLLLGSGLVTLRAARRRKA